MLGDVVLVLIFGLPLGGLFLLGFIEFGYRVRRRRRERELEWQRSRDWIDGYAHGVKLDGDDRQRELDRLRR